MIQIWQCSNMKTTQPLQTLDWRSMHSVTPPTPQKLWFDLRTRCATGNPQAAQQEFMGAVQEDCNSGSRHNKELDQSGTLWAGRWGSGPPPSSPRLAPRSRSASPLTDWWPFGRRHHSASWAISTDKYRFWWEVTVDHKTFFARGYIIPSSGVLSSH